MNILVITPINPVEIVELANQFSKLISRKNSVVSPQVFALLSESINDNKTYVEENFLFAHSIAKNPQFCLKNQEKNLVVWGNIPKSNKTFKWDHIVYFATAPFNDDKTDTYLEKATGIYNHAGLGYEWYTKADTEYTFPTFHHLEMFLKTRGIVPAEEGGLDEL